MEASAAVEAVLQTVAKSLKQATDGILDLIAPRRTTYSYPSEFAMPGGELKPSDHRTTSPPASRGPASGRLRRAYSFLTASPARIGPERMTLA